MDASDRMSQQARQAIDGAMQQARDQRAPIARADASILKAAEPTPAPTPAVGSTIHATEMGPSTPLLERG